MQKIVTQADFEQLRVSIDWHDAFIREGYVHSCRFLKRHEKGGAVFLGRHDPFPGQFVARVVILAGAGSGSAGCEFLCRGVVDYCLMPESEIELRADIDSDGTAVIYFSYDGKCYVRARSILYALISRGDVGPQLRLGYEGEDPDAISARPLGGAWRQCSGCCEGWEENPNVVFSRCPSCGELTELHA